jgi:hypothetical protein
MNVHFPTLPNLRIVQAWGNANPKMYPNGRHMGVDIAGLVGSAIYAAAVGVVYEVNLTGAHGYGRHVIIEHGNFRTLYAHLHEAHVKGSDIVEPGTVIGTMGGDPNDSDKIDGASTGPHLHFEVILPSQPQTDYIETFAGYTVDPIAYLLQNFVPRPIKLGTVKAKKGVRVRISSGTDDDKDVIIGAVKYKDTVEIVDVKTAQGDTWCRVRSLRAEWVCAVYKGEELIALKDAPVVVRDTPVEQPALDEKSIRLDEVLRLITYLENRKSELE